MSGTTPAERHLGIIELAQVCTAMQIRNIDLFQRLGDWVVDTRDPELQRLFAEACHRHAWHAELWAQRSPSIPPIDDDSDHTTATRPDTAGVAPADRAAAYATAIDGLLSDTTALSGRIDALLDPGTARTIDLVLADGRQIRQRLAAAGYG